MALLTAREAAKRLGKDERTIRRWVASGKIQQKTSASNRMALDEQDIERLAASLTQEDQEKRQELTDLQARVDQLEQEQARILARLALLENASEARTARPLASIGEPYSSRPRPPVRTHITTLQELATPDDVPPASRQATEFAIAHNVNRATFRDQMTKGVHGDLVAHIPLPKPNKPKETDRWLSPEQQRSAIAFWDRHGTIWQPCTVPDCVICDSGDQAAPVGLFDTPGEG